MFSIPDAKKDKECVCVCVFLCERVYARSYDLSSAGET